MEVDELRRLLYSELDALEDQSDDSDDGKSVELVATSCQDVAEDVADIDGDDWNDLMTSLKTVNKRFQVVEESLQDDVNEEEVERDHAPTIGEAANRVCKAIVLQEMGCEESVQILVRDTCDRQQLVELMDRIIDSIELSAPVFRPLSTLGNASHCSHVLVDMSSLPQLIIDEVDEIDEIDGVPGVVNREGPSSFSTEKVHNGDDDHGERIHLEMVQQELLDAEEILRIQADNAARSAEEKKRHLLEKRRLREAELQEISTTKVSLTLQKLWRGYATRSSFRSVIEQARIKRREDEVEEKRRAHLLEEEEEHRRVAQEEATARQRQEKAEKQEQDRLAKERREEVERRELQAKLQMERDHELFLMEQRRRHEEEQRRREEAERTAMAAMEALSLLTCARMKIEEPDVEYDFDYESDYDCESTHTDQRSDPTDGGSQHSSCNNAPSSSSCRKAIVAMNQVGDSVEGWETVMGPPNTQMSEREERAIASRIRGMVPFWEGLTLSSARIAATARDRLRYLRAAAVQQLPASTDQVSSTDAHDADKSSLRPLAAWTAPVDALMQALQCYRSFETRTSVCKRLVAFRRLADSSSTSASREHPLSGGRNDAKSVSRQPQPLSTEEQDRLHSFGLRCPEEVAPEVYRDISLCVESVADCSFLRAFSSTLRSLQLNVNKLRNLRGLEDMTALEELSATDNAISDTAALSSLTSLRVLRLGDNHLTADAVATAFAGLPRLHTLSLNTNKLTTLPVLTGCDGLQRLEVYHNTIASVSVDSLRALKSLTHLDMGRNKLEYINGEALSQCPLLQTLVLSQNALKRPPSPLYLPNLRTLWLSGNRLDSLVDWEPQSGPNDLFAWPVFLPLLEKLHLQDNALSDLPAAALCNLPLLSHLDVSFNAITSVNGLRGLQHLPALSVLNLNDNPVYSSAASETRAGEVNELHALLVHECLSLRVLSGTALTRPTHARPHHPTADAVATPLVVSKLCAENMWELGGLSGILRPADAAVNAAPSSDTESNRLQCVLAEHRRRQSAGDGTRWHWLGPHDARPLHHQLQVRALHDSVNSGANPPDTSGSGGGGGGVGLCNTSHSSRAFVQLLQGLCSSHNVLRAREKNDTTAAKRAEGAPNTAAHAAANEDPRLQWELLCTQQLLQHTQSILNWTAAAGSTATNADIRLISMRADGAGTMRLSAPADVRLVSFDDIFGEGDDDDGRVGTGAVSTTAPGATPTRASDLSPSEGHQSTATAALPEGRGGLSKAQALWRGHRLRKQVRGIMASSRYCDDELDEMLNGCGAGYNSNGDPQLDALEALGMGLDSYDDLLHPMGLRGDWHQMAVSEGAMDDEEGEEVVNAPFVYGDHRRRGSFARSRGTGEATGGPALDRASIYSDRGNPGNMAAGNMAAGGMAAGVMSWPPPVSRPSTSFTDTSSLSAASSHAHTEPDDSISVRSHSAHQGDGAGIAEMYGERAGPFSPTKSPRSRADALSEEWGISDPKVLHAILKRNKRMKSFAAAKESREREKDPEVRYQRFVKNSFKTAAGASSPAAGGGGGAGMGGRGNAGCHMGTGRGRGGRFGGGARKTVPMPAWALGSAENDT